MTLPRKAASAARLEDDQDDAAAARSGRFRVRIDAFGRLIPELAPVDPDEPPPSDRR